MMHTCKDYMILSLKESNMSNTYLSNDEWLFDSEDIAEAYAKLIDIKRYRIVRERHKYRIIRCSDYDLEDKEMLAIGDRVYHPLLGYIKVMDITELSSGDSGGYNIIDVELKVKKFGIVFSTGDIGCSNFNGIKQLEMFYKKFPGLNTVLSDLSTIISTGGLMEPKLYHIIKGMIMIVVLSIAVIYSLVSIYLLLKY